jgi:DNA polymerase-3 subunit delta'
LSAGHPAPWLEAPRAQLRSALAAGRFPHALLLQANAGTGGEELAIWVAQLLLCRGPAPRPCAECLDCRRVRDDQHPDFVRVSPLEESRQVRVDQIRELGATLALTSHGRGYKVALIAPADALNPNAANALLKTLEEPAANTLLVLLAADLSRLPATIRSRCQRLRILPPTRAASLAWLEAQRPGEPWGAALAALGNAPFAALTVDVAALEKLRTETLQAIAAAARGMADTSAIAERWGRGDTAAHLRAIENWISERIREAAGGARGSADLRAAAHLSESRSDLNIRGLFALLDQTRDLVALLDTPLNRALGIENLLRSFRSHAGAGRP